MTSTPTHNHRPSRWRAWWKGSVWLCCFLILLPTALPTFDTPIHPTGPSPIELPEGEEKPPIEDEDETKEPTGGGKLGSAQSLLRQSRSRRAGQTIARAFAWLVHLPHHHEGDGAYSLPICTPFTLGVNLPLRC